jgi:hypothetical protein
MLPAVYGPLRNPGASSGIHQIGGVVPRANRFRGHKAYLEKGPEMNTRGNICDNCGVISGLSQTESKHLSKRINKSVR